MDITYPYTKIRKNFGKQYFFVDDGPKLVEDLRPDRSISDKYLTRNLLHKGVQMSRMMSENDVNTYRKEYCEHGLNHLEGGWPKDLDTHDEEAVLRFRKKVERQDNYVAALKNLTVPMEHAILQNNAVNIYEQYYPDVMKEMSNDHETCRIQSTFKDPIEPSRPITHCSWSPEGDEFSLSHCNTAFQRNFNKSFESYIWNVENPNTPIVVFDAGSPILCLEYNSKDAHWLAGGLYSGQVAHFDSRKGPKPTDVSQVEHSHRDPAHSVLWTNSKTGMEFFSTSTDGTVKWWDCRRLERPIDGIILDTSRTDKPTIQRAHGASCLEYEFSIPVKYTVGTDTGYIISGNRKGTNHQEKLPWMLKSHAGPIYSLQRNQVFTKNILAVGDWSAKIWSEDCKESAIIWTKNHEMRLTAGEWSGSRLSVFFLTREDGVLDLWDILFDQKRPFISLKLCNEPLTAVRVKDDGLLVLTANSIGTAYVVRYPSHMAESSKNDKVFLSAMFDRESRREKVLETKNKEIKLRLREVAITKEVKETEEGEERPKTEFEIQVENYKNALENDYRNETGLAKEKQEEAEEIER